MPQRTSRNDKQMCLRIPLATYKSWKSEADASGITVAALIRLRMSGHEIVATVRKAG